MDLDSDHSLAAERKTPDIKVNFYSPSCVAGERRGGANMPGTGIGSIIPGQGEFSK